MPRNAAGTYTLPLPPVVTDTTITSNFENTTDSDIGVELTNSLDRNGRGGMLAPFKIFDGTLAAPGMAFLQEPGTGLWRAGAGVMNAAVLGANVMTFGVNSVTIPPGVTFNMNGTMAGLNLSGAAGVAKILGFQTAGVNRWQIRSDASAESGANAGSDFVINSYSDAGALIDNPITITRAASGNININRPMTGTLNQNLFNTSTTVNAFLSATQLRMGATNGNIGIGVAPAGDARIYMAGNWTTTASTGGYMIYSAGTLTLTAGHTGAIAHMALVPTVVTQNLGEAISHISTLRLAPTILTLGTDTVAVLATLRVEGQPVGGIVNAAIYVTGGVIRSVGDLEFGILATPDAEISYSNTTGSLILRSDPGNTLANTAMQIFADGAEQVRVVGASGATRFMTLTGSATNPTISVSGGSLNIGTSLLVRGDIGGTAGRVGISGDVDGEVLLGMRQYSAAGSQRSLLISVTNANGEIKYDATGAAAGFHAFYTGGTQRLAIGTDGSINVAAAGVIYGTGGLVVLAGSNTVDGADNAEVRIQSNGGGAIGPTRGAYARFFGNESASTGQIVIAAGNVANAFIDFRTGNAATRMVMTQNGEVIVGTTPAVAVGGNSLAFQVNGPTLITSSQSQARFTNDTGGANIYLGKSRATTVGTFTIVQNGDVLGSLVGCGADGVDIATVAGMIEFRVDGAPAANIVPGRITFLTADAAGVLTEGLRLDSVGNLHIQRGAVLHFNANAAALANADIGRTAVNGLSMRAVAGSTNDFAVLSATGAVMLQNPTGTGNIQFIGTVGIGNAPAATTQLNLAGGTAGLSSLRLPHGAAPTTPVNGDMWTTTAGLFVRINGVTVGPLT